MNNRNYKKEELERLLSKAAMVYYHPDDKPVSHSEILDITSLIYRAVKKEHEKMGIDREMILDKELPFADLAIGFNKNEVYLFFKTDAEAQRFSRLYDELFAQPEINNLIRKCDAKGFGISRCASKDIGFDENSYKVFIKDDDKVKYYLHHLHPEYMTRTDARAIIDHYDEIVPRVADAKEEDFSDKERVLGLAPYAVISNNPADNTAADAFWGEYQDRVAAAKKVKDDGWVSQIKPIIDKMHGREI